MIRLSVLISLLEDSGRFATHMGYDAVDLRGWADDSLLGTFLILNRTAVVVEQWPLSWKTIMEREQIKQMLYGGKKK